eukprot:gnl/TRDRNA2_/TRDRNA2_190202_c0_seq1.p1 gnl/TRDRNA2_/TRDRNA2_190202_c0~~gnl/TRDRNA2_/TRDRNA2_190202_c0_seq1.p1  ORF type:complete len:186 (+),score=15.80 gnl/TRDRNA2_/TRDRNA2_190202_c0_seq1:94-651(+)
MAWKETPRHAPPGCVEVYILSLDCLPHRRGSGEVWWHDRFAVRIRWPSKPQLGIASLEGLEAQDWNAKRIHSCYIYVDRSLRLPWSPGTRSITLSVYEQDLMQEVLVGEVELPIEDMGFGEPRRYPIYGPNGTSTEGRAHVAVLLPENLRGGGDWPAPPARRIERPWWSALCLCSTMDRGAASVV